MLTAEDRAEFGPRVFQLIAERMPEMLGVVLAVEVGSTAHGISAGHDDRDFTVVVHETLADVVVANELRGGRVIRTAAEGRKSEPGDIDINVYTFRRFVRLVEKGNPSILAALFAGPGETLLAASYLNLPTLRDLAWNQRTGYAFLGYCNAQIKRWREGKISTRVNRPELIKLHGYDTKYAAHAIRLGWQGTEFMTTGKMSIPLEPERAELLRRIRAGEIPEARARGMAVDAMSDLYNTMEATVAPRSPDHEGFNRVILEYYGLPAPRA